MIISSQQSVVSSQQKKVWMRFLLTTAYGC